MPLQPLPPLLLLILLLTPAAVSSARVAVREAPRVQIPRQGILAGREVLVTRTQRTRQYLGIPFAQPPLASLRFSPPVTSPLPSWQEPRNSTFQPACMQDRDRFEEHDQLRLESKLFPEDRLIEFNEDCLYLNVFAPDGTPPNEGWPVLVWFHSGDFLVGAPHLWDASVFAIRQKVIVVTTAYRLNVFGFFTTMDGFAPGNLGLLDQVAALDWVQGQIRIFDGDPAKVVIGGHGAGAISVGLHLVSPLSQGKFSAALQMSGSPLTPGVIKSHGRGVVAEISDNFNCDEIMVCLRKISPSILLTQTGAAADWGPVVDGPHVNDSADAFLPAHPAQLFEEERFAKVPLMTGYADMEEALDLARRDSGDADFDKDSFDTLIGDTALDGVPEPDDNETCFLDKSFVRDSVSFFYNSDPQTVDGITLKQKFAYYMTEKKYGSSIFNQSFHMSKFVPVFLYRFDYRMKTTGVLDLRDWMTVPQFGEIPFVLGMPYWTSISSQIVWNSADKKVADSVMALWGNFTKYFKPAQHGRSLRWEPFDPTAPGAMLLDRVFNMSDSTAVNYKALSFWNDYFPKVIRIATQCCNATSAAVIPRPALTGLLTSLHPHRILAASTALSCLLAVLFTNLCKVVILIG